MKRLLEILSDAMSDAFERAGYDRPLGLVRVSDRPDLCEYQCNGAMAAAKRYHKAPMAVAEDVMKALGEMGTLPFAAECVKPGFLNLTADPAFLSGYLREMAAAPDMGIPRAEPVKKILIDYGGPNVAKPLHVGHLRAAVIGEALKRLLRSVGHDVTGDVHLGDWGLQIGLIITELRERKPDLPYFAEGEAEYPAEAPFTISELEEIYPAASARAKTDGDFHAKALAATRELQEGRPGYRALWKKIMEISVADLKENYRRLNVDFDLWKGESDVQPLIPGLLEDLEKRGIARESEGALVVDVALPEDKKEMPPCIVRKSDGAALYSTTDIATILERVQLFHPDEIIYVVDKRQGMHFQQVFRTVKKAGIADDHLELVHVGFGTMNGRDGKPFRTREGGVMRLSSLLNEIEEEMILKIRDNRNVRTGDAGDTAKAVALSAVKYGDLSNQAAKDYVFDVEKFTSFEGNTGPYILYTVVRIKSICERAAGEDLRAAEAFPFAAPGSPEEKALMLDLAGFGAMVGDAASELAPHRICGYIYQLSNDFNRFYHSTRILQEADAERRISWLALLKLTQSVLEKSIDILGFGAPDRM